MAKITVFGGTGYTGTAIVAEAVARGHEVTSVSRNAPAAKIEGVTYVNGSVLADDRSDLVTASDIVVATLAPRGELAGKVAPLYQTIAATAQQAGTRLIVVGGFSSLRREAGGPRMADVEEIPAQFADEAREMSGLAEWLTTAPAKLDWLYVSPAATYGSFNPGEARGAFRVGGDVAFFDAEGRSELSAPDFAVAIVDLAEGDDHHREHVSVAY